MNKIQSLLISAVAALNLLSTQTEARAQTERPTRLVIGRSDGISFTGGYNYVAGTDLRLEHDVRPKTSISLSAGFNMYHLNEGFIEDNLAYIPLKAGLKVFPRNRFYYSLEAGLAIGIKSEADTYPFIYAPGMGFKAGRFDLGLRYEHMTGRIVDYLDEIKRPNQLAFRVAYGFKLK